MRRIHKSRGILHNHQVPYQGLSIYQSGHLHPFISLSAPTIMTPVTFYPRLYFLKYKINNARVFHGLDLRTSRPQHCVLGSFHKDRADI
ncbi:hypothetical protein BJX64DRAFT_187349 [Aspergillus heterothallicus]